MAMMISSGVDAVSMIIIWLMWIVLLIMGFTTYLISHFKRVDLFNAFAFIFLTYWMILTTVLDCILMEVILEVPLPYKSPIIYIFNLILLMRAPPVLNYNFKAIHALFFGGTIFTGISAGASDLAGSEVALLMGMFVVAWIGVCINVSKDGIDRSDQYKQKVHSEKTHSEKIHSEILNEDSFDSQDRLANTGLEVAVNNLKQIERLIDF